MIDFSGWKECQKARCLQRDYWPSLYCLALPDEVQELPDALGKPVEGTATAWLCQGTQCMAPISTLEELQAGVEQGAKLLG